MNPRFRDGIQYTHRPTKGPSFAQLHYGAPRGIATRRPLWKRITAQGWVWICSIAGYLAFVGYLIWSAHK